MRIALWIMVGMAAVPLVVAADVIHLKDGQVLEGEIKRSEGGWRVTLDNGATVEIGEGEIARVEIKPRSFEGPKGDAVAMSRLDSLRKSLEHLDDPQIAIDRYESFIERHRETPAAAAAVAEQKRWLDRQQQGLVRLGDQWVTPERRDELRDEATVLAAEARQLIKLGRLTEAQPILTKALETDPGNVSALYLQALLQYRADRLAAARRAFEQVNAVEKDHAPTLNNLAVIAWRQNRTTDALLLYERAMTASPMDQTILSNVAEALNALPRDMQKNALAQRVYRLFNEQDQRLQQQLVTEGVYRWGAQYLTREQFEQVQAKQQEIQQKLDAMAEQFQAVEERIRDIDIKGEANDRILRQLEAGSYHRTPDGTLVRLPLPPVYREIQRDNERLKLERRQAVAELDRLRQSAAELQAQIPQPTFTGVQSMIGVEGTPLIPPVAQAKTTSPTPQPMETVREVKIGPATQPTTQPLR